MNKRGILLYLLFLLVLSNYVYAEAIIANHTAVTDFDNGNIPQYYINKAKTDFRIGYAHTSHGSHITDGMYYLSTQSTDYSYNMQSAQQYYSNDGFTYCSDPTRFTNSSSFFHNYYHCLGDLGTYGSSYVPDWISETTEPVLRTSRDRNVVMWSFGCELRSNGCDTQSVRILNEAELYSHYLTPMSNLEQQNPNVKFVYMTGYLDGTGSTGLLHQKNELIRQYVKNNNKILFDFADIERYDPSGRDLLDLAAGYGTTVDGDGCGYLNNGVPSNWCVEWCTSHPGECDNLNFGTNYYCVHVGPAPAESYYGNLNCEMKGKTFWWMLARMAGWDGTPACHSDSECGTGGTCNLGICEGGIQTSCQLNSASWNNLCDQVVTEGTEVTLNVTGTDCDGQTINFQILEEDSVFERTTISLSNPPQQTIFNGDNAIQTWTTEWINDSGSLTDEDPEYVFNVSLASNSSNSILSSCYLKVSKTVVNTITPTINSVSSASLGNNQNYTISGSNFGIKSPVAPLTSLNSNIEQSISGAVFSAPNWAQVSVSSFNAIYTNSDAHSGSNSILFNYNSQLPWSQIRFDSITGYDKFYVTTWLKFIKNDNCNPVQWKNWRLSSSPGYEINDEPTTTEIIGDHWVSSGLWGNGGVQCYYNGGTMGGPSYSIASDAFVFNQWQRIEQYYQRSSAPNTADGITWIKRMGRPGYLANVNSFITHDADDGLWRYLRMGQAYFYDGCSAEDAEIYYDDIYIDNTLARVEICNNQNISLATQCEIQIPHTTWNDNTIQFTANKGSFGNEQLYLFVIDANGNASTDYPIAFSQTTPVCGNTIIEIGEQCDDGNTIGADGCSATCQLECGDTLCQVWETCSTCPADCGTCPTICVLNSALWNGLAISQIVNEGTQVTLNVTGTNCDGQTISFQIIEADSTSTNEIPVLTNPPANTIFNGNLATQTWTTQWINDTDGPNDDPDYIFNATLVSNTSISTIVNTNYRLEVTNNLPACTNVDGDIYNATVGCGPIDCNDNNATIWQNLTGYPDKDGDNHYSPISERVCSGTILPLGYSSIQGTDCDDNDPTKYSTAILYRDADRDSYGVNPVIENYCYGAALSLTVYMSQNNLSLTNTDCNDNNININPGVQEICNNIDDNCNNQTDEGLTCNCILNSDCLNSTSISTNICSGNLVVRDLIITNYSCQTGACVQDIQSITPEIVEDCSESSLICSNNACDFITQTINLNTGWNIITQRLNTTLRSDMLNSAFVLRYDQGSWDIDAMNIIGDQFNLEPLRGYYVYSLSPKTLSFEGPYLNPGYKYELQTNQWNIFAVNRTDLFSTIYPSLSSNIFGIYTAGISGSSFSFTGIDHSTSNLDKNNIYWANLEAPETSPLKNVKTTSTLDGLKSLLGFIFRNF